MKRLILSVSIATLLVLSMSGCGQTGPLYLPPPEPSSPRATPKPEEEEAENAQLLSFDKPLKQSDGKDA